MNYDFDKIIDRENTYSIKYSREKFGKPEGCIPMWIADMDLESPPAVLEALQKRVNHGVFGYTTPDDEYFEVVGDWYKKRFGWNINREWFTLVPKVVPAISFAINAFTKENDGVLIMEPVYHPFATAIRSYNRKVVINELICCKGKYSIDFDDFEEKIKQSKLLILCSPHNPVGRVWTTEELTRIGEICLRNNVIVVSDEIHQDLVYSGYKHTVFANIDQAFADITVTCTAPTKTFNIAGLPISNIFISNKELRKKFNYQFEACGFGSPAALSLVACKAAYAEGEQWLEELLVYLKENMNTIDGFMKKNLSKISLVEAEGTYLAWLDFSKLGISDKKLDELIEQKAKLWVEPGVKFGRSGAGFRRMNVGCSRATINEALRRLESVFKNI